MGVGEVDVSTRVLDLVVVQWEDDKDEEEEGRDGFADDATVKGEEKGSG